MAPVAATAFTWVFVLIPLLIVWGLAIYDIVRREMSRSTKAGWIILVLLLPLAGTLLYFLLRKPTQQEIRLAEEASLESPRYPGDVRGGRGRAP